MTERILISGFMVVKDVVAQGYPFLEAITAALRVCDEFLISEGYSSDETWSALEWLQRKFPDKIRLYRDEWHGSRWHGQIIAEMQNVVLARCRGEYCLNVQANEILHEDTCEELRALPELYPGAEIFNLPYYHFLGSHILWMQDYRKRLFKNRPYLLSCGDGYDVFFDRRRMWRTPRKMWRCSVRGLGIRTYYLRKPFYRYTGLFPRNYVAKLEARRELYQDPAVLQGYLDAQAEAKKALENMDTSRTPAREFWELMREQYNAWHANKKPSIGDVFPNRTIGDVDGMPRVMEHLRDRWEYNLEDSMRGLEGFSYKN